MAAPQLSTARTRCHGRLQLVPPAMEACAEGPGGRLESGRDAFGTVSEQASVAEVLCKGAVWRWRHGGAAGHPARL